MEENNKKHALLSGDRIRVLDSLCRTSMPSEEIAKKARVTTMFVDLYRPNVHVDKSALWTPPELYLG